MCPLSGGCVALADVWSQLVQITLPRWAGVAVALFAVDLLDADIGRATQSVTRIAGVTSELQMALRETRERDLLRRALAIQRSTERHAASLDRKTGGTAPVAAPAPAPAPLP